MHYSASLQALFRYPANPATVAGAYEAISYRQLSAMARLVKRINLARRSQNAPFAKFSSSLHVASLSPFGKICSPLHRCGSFLGFVVSFGVRPVRSLFPSLHASRSSFEALSASFQDELAACEETMLRGTLRQRG